MTATKQQPMDLMCALEIAVNNLVLALKEKKLFRDKPKPEKLEYSGIRDYYSKIYDSLDKYNQHLSDYSDLVSGRGIIEEVGSVISTGEGEVEEAMDIVGQCRGQHETKETKLKDTIIHCAKRISHAFYIVELSTGYTVLSEFMGEAELKKLKSDEILNKFPSVLEENKLKFAAFYNIRNNTIKRMEEFKLLPSS